MNRHPILSDTQRQAITTVHFDLDEREIERYWTLSEHDLLRINRRRRDTNRFGFAVQLCLLRFPGWPPRPGDKVPVPLLAYVAQQLEIKTDNIEEYFRRQPTRSDHFREILDLYGFRFYNQRAEQELTDWIRAEAHHWNTPTGVFMALLDQMRHRRIVLPAVSQTEHLAWRVYRQVEDEALGELAGMLSALQRSELEDLLLPSIESDDRNLTWLRRPIGSPGAKGMLDLIDRLEFIRAIELKPASANGISPLLLRQLAGRGARHTLQHLREYDHRKRFGIVVAYLLHNLPHFIDESIDMFTRLVGRWFNKADKRRWAVFHSNGRSINQKLYDFIILGQALVDARHHKRDLSEAVESAFGWNELATSVEEIEKLAAPPDFSNLDQLAAQYPQARQYAPRFLAALSFEAIPRRQSLLKAIEMLRAMNQAEQAAVPKNAPREFVPRRWRAYVFDGDKIDRSYYELCVLSELSWAL